MPTCNDCIHAVFDKTQWLFGLSSGFALGPVCSNHPESPGQWKCLVRSRPCRNFRPKHQEPLRLESPKPPNDRVRYIALTKGKFATVETADYKHLMRFRWHAKETRGRFYAATVIKGKSVAMHRMLLTPPPGMVVDHIDGNGLNNCRSNLRLCTPEQNRRNTRPRRKSSPYLGVSRSGDKFKVQIKHNGRTHYLGQFESETEAARARDEKAKQLHGPYAWLNFPEAPPSS